MPDDLSRIRQVDWSGKSEATLCSQLVMPVLLRLGYGEHTPHPVHEQATYALRDPSYNRGSRRVRLDYLPTIYEKGLWVMEVKGSDEAVDPSTLGQVRDYAIHPEVRAALMVTVDARGFCVFDPWGTHWDEPILAIPLNEVAARFDELDAVLGVERVAEVIRRRHLDHLERALSASVDFGVLDQASREFDEKLNSARTAIHERRAEIRQLAAREALELHERVIKRSGVWGVAQHWNTVWAQNRASANEFREAVLAQDPRQRPTQIRQFRPAIEAIFKDPPVASGEHDLYRPLWWLHIVVLGGSISLRGETGCEPAATEVARQAIRDCILDFPDDPIAAAAWNYQRAAVPVVMRICALAPLDDMSRKALPRVSAEDRIRYPHLYRPAWFFELNVKSTMLRLLAQVDPWTPEHLNRMADEIRAQELPVPAQLNELGPGGDPSLSLWATTDPLLESGLYALGWDDKADELLAEMPDVVDAIREAYESPDQWLRRAAAQIADRLRLT